ncbi:hypothetical protein [Synergistes jonesii]|uniref:hypothetical protein n=1 Tax=Synergistes jonesii TaxID=2754 RepID=UPI00248EC5B1|nr:hypothetical protein [Synergistes jonesii]
MITFKLRGRATRAAAASLALLLFLLPWQPAYAALEGRGTEEEPYIIRTVDDLKVLGGTFTVKSGCYRLANDIDASGEELPILGSDGTPHGYRFRGVLDGAGHKITYRCTPDEFTHGGHTTWKDKGALFDTNYGTIKNLIVEGSVDFAFDPADKDNHGNRGAGGIVYENRGLIENCISRVNISAKFFPVGGIAAKSWGGRIINCAYTGTISVDNGGARKALSEMFPNDPIPADVVGGIVGSAMYRSVQDEYGTLLKKIEAVNESCVFTGRIALSEEIHNAANGTGVGPIWGYNDGGVGGGSRVWDTARITAGGREYKPSDAEFPGRGGLDAGAFVDTKLLSISLNSALMGDVRASADVSYFTSEEGREPGGTRWSVRVEEGASPEFRIYPSTGYAVKYAALDGTNLGAVDSYRFAPITEDGHTLSVYFSPEGGAGFTPLPVVSPIKLDGSGEALKVGGVAAIEFAKLPSEVQGFAEKDASGTAVTDPLAARLALGPAEESVDLESPILPMPLTHCKADKGATALTAYQCSLSGYAGEKASDLKIFAMLSSERAVELTRACTPGAIGDGEFAITDADGEELPPDALIQEDEIYFVSVAFRDNGQYDLDPEEGHLLLAAFAAKGIEKESPDTPGGEGEGSASKSGSGCDAGLGSLALLAFAMSAARRSRKIRRRGDAVK